MSLDLSSVRTLQSVQTQAQEGPGLEKELGRTAFLELMIAQVQNQDPMEPAKNEAFIAQLAQFSSVEGIQNLNESMDSLVASLRSSVTMDAANLVGRNVLIATSQTALNNRGGIGGVIDLTEAAGNLTVEIRNDAGQVVADVNMGAQPPGEVRFDWDGLTAGGEPLPQGFYQVSAYAEVNGIVQEYEVNLPDQVVSVSIEDGALLANLAGGTSVPASQIKEIQ